MSEKKLPKTGVVIVSCDRPISLKPAYHSTLDTGHDELEMVYIVDSASVKPDVKRVLECIQSDHKKHAPRTALQLHQLLERKLPGSARNHAYRQMTLDGIELILNLDDDDVYRPGFVQTMRVEFERLGRPDILVPSQIAKQWGPGGMIEQVYSHIPKELSEFDAWVRLCMMGGTFGISAAALEKFGGFDEMKPGDEWIRMLYRWVLHGARVEQAYTNFTRSYLWMQHHSDVHDNRRTMDRSTAYDVARDVWSQHIAGAEAGKFGVIAAIAAES